MPRGVDRQRLALEMRRAAKPGIALIVLIVACFACMTLIFANIGVKFPWQGSYVRQIALDDAKGIVPKEQTVRLAGITVGRIQDIELVGGRPIATISIDPQYGPLYRNAQLRLRPETPLDDMYLDILSRGTPSAGQLPANQVLPAQRTVTPVDISSVLDVFNADLRSRVKASVDSLGQGLGPEGPNFEQALVDLAPFLAAAKQLTYQTAIRRTETARLIHNFGVMTAELASRDADVRQLVASGAASLSELGNNESSVEAVINQLPPTMSQLESTFATVRSTADHLDPAFDSLQSVASTLPAGLTGLTRFAVAAEPALAKLRAPLPGLNRLMRAMRPTASGLHSSFAQLQPIPSQFNYVTRLVVPCEPSLAKFFQNTISLGKFQSDLSVILRGETVAGTNSGGGVVNDQSAAQSCAPGGT